MIVIENTHIFSIYFVKRIELEEHYTIVKISSKCLNMDDNFRELRKEIIILKLLLLA